MGQYLYNIEGTEIEIIDTYVGDEEARDEQKCRAMKILAAGIKRNMAKQEQRREEGELQ